MITPPPRLLPTLAGIVLTLANHGSCEDSPPAADASKSEALPTFIAQRTEADESGRAQITFMLQSCEAYRISASSHPEEELTLNPQAMLRWNNPVVGTADGITVVWTRAGRPQVAAQVFRNRKGQWCHELVALTPDPLIVQRGDDVVWSPRAVCTVEQLPQAPLPASTPAARLVQLRRSAERFSASIDFRHEGEATKTERYELRLMTNPLYRYGSVDGSLGDGAVFAFVMGTVPKVLLLLESRETTDGDRWHYSLSPITAYGVAARLDGKTVWEHEESARRTDVANPFYFARFSE